MAFQRRKSPAIGVKSRYPGFVPFALATKIEKAPSAKLAAKKVAARAVPARKAPKALPKPVPLVPIGAIAFDRSAAMYAEK